MIKISLEERIDLVFGDKAVCYYCQGKLIRKYTSYGHKVLIDTMSCTVCGHNNYIEVEY